MADAPAGAEVSFGPQAVWELALRDEVDMVLVAIVGAAGLEVTYRALEAGKRVALANKESLVVGGELIMPMAARGQLVPVDSEHSAIFQCYAGEDPKEARRIWLTCSGGPFYGRTRAELEGVTAADALRHPTWSMGAKITVDSATLMNKGLERIEAMRLFGVGLDEVEVLIQRESKIHSMVEYRDGSVIAHLGASDMRVPIQYAFSWPHRWEAPCAPLDFRELAGLTFGTPDEDAFRCLALAGRAAREGGTMPAAMNAANEVAVDAFLAGELGFTGIDRVVERVMDAHDARPVESIGQLEDVDARAREAARAAVREVGA